MFGSVLRRNLGAPGGRRRRARQLSADPLGGADSMSAFNIRDATLSDVPVLARLIAAFRDHLNAKVPTGSDIQAHLPRALRDPGIEFACAWINDEAVGYTQTRFLTSV